MGALPLLAIASVSCWLVGVPASRVAVAAALYGVVAILFLRQFEAVSAAPGIGAANRVTLVRMMLVLPVAAIATAPGPMPDIGYWYLLGLAIFVTLLDGVDGRVARRTGTECALGARFDMEVDALLIMVLSAVAWQTGKVGAWALLIGGIRYLFVAAGMLWGPLKHPLPPSLRRKSVCVVQSIVLIVAVAPITPGRFAATTSAAALLLLIYSFATDIVWLVVAHRKRVVTPARIGSGA